MIRPTERAEFVRDVLWATLDAAQLASAARLHAVDPDREYLALRARPAPGRGIDELARALGLGRGQADGSGLGAIVNGHLVGFVSSLPRGTVAGVAGVGPARPLPLLHKSFQMATRALYTADRRKMTGVCEFSQLGLLPAILSDRATGTALCDRYFTPLGTPISRRRSSRRSASTWRAACRPPAPRRCSACIRTPCDTASRSSRS